MSKPLKYSRYKRPHTTYTDTLQNKDAMLKKLKKYKRVENIDDVRFRTHVRYVTLNREKKQRFCVGGLLIKKHEKYVKLSNGKYCWCVQRYHYTDDKIEEQENKVNELHNEGHNEGHLEDEEETEYEEPIFETIFFRRITPDEEEEQIEEEYARRTKKLREKINKLLEIIKLQDIKIKNLETMV